MINDCGQLCMPVHVRSTAPESTQRKRNPRKTLIGHNKSQPNGPRWWFSSRTPDSVFKIQWQGVLLPPPPPRFPHLWCGGRRSAAGCRRGLPRRPTGSQAWRLCPRWPRWKRKMWRSCATWSLGGPRFAVSEELVPCRAPPRLHPPPPHPRLHHPALWAEEHRWSIRCFFSASVVTNPVSPLISSSGEKYQSA